MDICAGGPAEIPLLEVLRETIFGENGHVSRTPLAKSLEGRKDLLILIAHLEGNPIGFKIGYGIEPGVYYSKAGGVLKDYRRNGLAKRMQQWQHDFARGQGYETVEFSTHNHFPQMMLFGLNSGFSPIGCQLRAGGSLSIRFSKSLKQDTAPITPEERAAAEARLRTLPEPGTFECAISDRPLLFEAVRQGFAIRGILQGADGQTSCLLKRETNAPM